MYDAAKLKNAILFNTVETLPSGPDLDLEITRLVELANSSEQPIRHYIGFEISGLIHIGTGIACALKIKTLQDAGVECSIFLANYHAWLNNKLDGTFDTIEKVAREYFAPVMRMSLIVVGANPDKVNFVFAKDLYEEKHNELSFFDWDIRVSKHLTLNRVLKSMSIMGKTSGDSVEFASLRYPPMQVTDAYFMQTHLVHAGLDQRKVHVLMREIALVVDEEIALKLDDKRIKPIAIHHALLLGMSAPKTDGTTTKMNPTEIEDGKMSKSRPDSAIWVHDNLEEITRKLKKAYCPMPKSEQSREEIVAEQTWNPLLNWCKLIVFPAGKTLLVERVEEWGGNVEYTTYTELEEAYFNGKLHPVDFKLSLAQTLANWFAPMYYWAIEHEEAVNLVINSRKK